MMGLTLLILLLFLNGLPTMGGYYQRHTEIAEHIHGINIYNLFSSNTPDRKDKDVAEFLDKLDQLLAGKNEYQFEPIVMDK